jgi:alkanesulfonate monooxygenase SsuD/methylene tetrahydromethanopterin reductase-like flavin-dependent oxidoreductase (luciferase family)
MTIKLGLILPTSTPDPSRPVLGDVGAAARLAEEAGVESVWSTDHLIASAPMLDSTVVLATAAAVTSRVRIGYGVMLLALRPVAWAAKQVSSLQYVSGDRVLLGVGTGNPAHGDVGWRAAGVSYAERGRLTDEALEVLPELIAGRTVAVEPGADLVRVDALEGGAAVAPGAGGRDRVEVALAPGAVVPPILVAGAGAKAMERAARFGDGWVPIGLSVADVPGRLEALRELAEKQERPRPTVSIVAPPLDRTQAKAVEQLAAYGEAGVERVILAPSGDGWQRDYEWAAELQVAVG